MLKEPSPGEKVRETDALCVLLVILAYLLQVRTAFLPHLKTLQHLLLAINQSVLDGTAENYYQFQMYLQAPLLDRLWKLLPTQSYPSFTLLYVTYYAAGVCAFLFALYRLCRRVASAPASAFACLYLTALYPLFWYDNYFHPSDPWGAMLTALLVGLALDGDDEKPPYFVLLLISGFLWEKTVFLPVSVALARLLTPGGRARLPRILGTFALASAAAGLGQLLPRLHYGLKTTWDLAPLALDLSQSPDMIMKAAALFAAPLVYLALSGRKAPLLLRCLSLQLPILMLCYAAVYRSVVVGGFLYPFKEIRGLIVIVPCLWPAFALWLDRLFLAAAKPLDA